MRGLFKKQKKLLVEEFHRLTGIEQIDYPICDDIPEETYNYILMINPFETFDSHVDRLFSDLVFEESRNVR